MITVSDAFKQAWLNGNQKSILLSFSDGTTIDDDGIVLESFSLEQALCTEDQLCFGLTSSACCKVQIFNTGKQYKGLTMTVSMAAVDEEEQYYIQNLGTYKVDSDVRSDDRAYRTLTAYDALYDVLNTNYAEWYNSYFDSHGTPSMVHFRNAFFEHIGIEQETATLEQDSLVLRKKSGVTSLSGADIILGICETSATFGFLNYDGRFQYVAISDRSRSFPADDLYPSNSLYPSEGADMVLDGNTVEGAPILGGLVYSDYFTHKITGARFEYTENTPEASAGTSNNVYQFRDSVLMYGQTTSLLQGICSSFVEMVKGFFYNPTKVTARARVWAQVGDLVRATSENDSVLFPIMKRSMSGITALYDTYEAQGTEYYTYSVNSYEAKQVEQETKSSEVERYVGEVEERVEEISQEWRNSVSAAIDVWDETNENIDEYGFGDPTIGDRVVDWDDSLVEWDIEGEGLPPDTSNYTEDDLYMGYLDTTTGFVYRLYRTAPNADTFVWTKVYTATGVETEYDPSDVGKKYLDEETGKVYVLESYTDDNVTRYRWVYSKTLGTTKAMLQTQITQTAEAITLEASRAVSSEAALQASIEINATAISSKVSSGDVVSEINQSAETISLTAGRLLITTGNFQLDASGNATATNFIAKNRLTIQTGSSEAWLEATNSGGNNGYISLKKSSSEYGSMMLNVLQANYLYVAGVQISASSFVLSSHLADQTLNINAASLKVQNKSVLTSHQSLEGYVNNVEQESWGNTWSTWSNHTIVKSATKSGKTITVTNVTVNVTSDKRLKKDIKSLDDFTKVYMRLEPIRYKYHDDLGFEDRGIHFGFIAQDFKRICDEEGVDLSNNEYAIWHTREADALGNEDKYVKDDALQEFIMDEFHALHIQMIQKQQRQIEEQGREIDALKSEVAELKAMLKEVLNVGKQK